MNLSVLARVEHENMIEAIALAGANAEGALVRRVDGVALIATGLPMRLFNQVIIERDDATADAVGAAVSLTRDRGDQFVVNLRVGADDRLIPLMHELGLLPVSDEPWIPGMALYPNSTAPGLDPMPDHEIRQVTDEAGIEDHTKTAAAGFELPESILRSIITPTMAQRAGIAAYVGYSDDGPITTGLGIRTGRAIGVYNIATLPAARRRGYGAAMTTRVIADGAAAGCDVAILQSSAMGYPVYERLGFRTVVEYMGYVEPESLSRISRNRDEAADRRDGNPSVAPGDERGPPGRRCNATPAQRRLEKSTQLSLERPSAATCSIRSSGQQGTLISPRTMPSRSSSIVARYGSIRLPL